jgi:hypothetical protein
VKSRKYERYSSVFLILTPREGATLAVKLDGETGLPKVPALLTVIEIAGEET